MLRFVASHLYKNGGTETVLIQVLNQLSEEHEVGLTIMGAAKKPGWLDRFSSNINIEILDVDTKLKKLKGYFNCANSIKNDDVVISLSPAFIKIVSMVRRIKRAKYPILSWIHFSLVEQDMFNPKDILKADYHLAISSKIQEQLMDMGVDSSRVFVINNPVKRERPIERIPHAGTNLAYVGRIMAGGQKNLQELFRGLASVETAHLFLVGTGDSLEAKKCQELAKQLGIESRVTFAGWQNNPWEYLADKKIDGVVLTSSFEGLPMVFLESIARGIPVISSRFDGYNDVVVEGVNGLSYEQGNIQGLAKSINNIKKVTNQKDIQSSIEKYYVDNYFARLKSILGRIDRSEIS